MTPRCTYIVYQEIEGEDFPEEAAHFDTMMRAITYAQGMAKDNGGRYYVSRRQEWRLTPVYHRAVAS